MLFNGAEINGAAFNASSVNYVLTADAGAYVATGNDATLFIGYVLTADAGAYVVEGKNADLFFDYRLYADASVYMATFSEASFYTGYQLQADAGLYQVLAIATQQLTAGVLQLADGRGINVQSESRNISVQKENRVISAGGPDSAIIVATERRTINVLKEPA